MGKVTKRNVLIVGLISIIGYANIKFMINMSSLQRQLMSIYKRHDANFDYSGYGAVVVNVQNRTSDIEKNQQVGNIVEESSIDHAVQFDAPPPHSKPDFCSHVSSINDKPFRHLRVPKRNESSLFGPLEGNHEKSELSSSAMKSLKFVLPSQALKSNNYEPEYMTDHLIQSLIMGGIVSDEDGSYNILDQTICYKESRLRTWEEDVEYAEEDNLKYLAFRLMFLAIHENQHRPARSEAVGRYCHTEDDEKNGIVAASGKSSNDEKNEEQGKFDFQCDPDTNYIIANIGVTNGMGMVLRENAIQPILLGLMTNRVVLWNNQKSSTFFSCPRKDWQCLFMPMTPCVVSQNDRRKAPFLSNAEVQEWTKTGEIPKQYENERIVKLWGSVPNQEPKGIREAFVRIIASVFNDDRNRNQISSSRQKSAWDLDSETIQSVNQYILNASDIGLSSLPLLYALRPNFRLRNELETALKNHVPNDFDPNKAIGIPIRAGDKCIKEQKCFGFDNYMDILTKMAEKRQNQTSNTYDTILLTSESKSIMHARFNYTNSKQLLDHTNNMTMTFPFRRFVVNEEDTLQGHGSPRHYNNNTSLFSADDVMISTMIAMKMQLLPETIIPNYCSNFHKVFGGFHKLGCGMANHPYLEWLQDNDDPSMRMDCGWKLKK